MRLRFAVTVLLLAAPSVCLAQAATHEQLLPPGSQLYIRWDGFAKHQKAYQNSAVGQMMKGEMGDFLRGFAKYAIRQLEKIALQEIRDKAKINAVKRGLIGSYNSFMNNGIVVGVELKGIDPFEIDTMVILPGGAKKKNSPMAFLEMMSKIDPNVKVPIKTMTKGGRTVKYLSEPPMHFAYWAEGEDLVLATGTTAPADLLNRVQGKGATLAKRSIYKGLKKFDEFPTWFEGFVDMPSLLKVAGEFKLEIDQVADALGVKSMESLTFYGGFDGAAERTVALVDVKKGPKKGLFRLIGTKAFTMADLPPMPPNVTMFSASRFNMPEVDDVGLDVADVILKIVDPFAQQTARQALKDFEQTNGVSIKKLFDSFDDLAVSYFDGNEGILGFGQVSLFKLKNEKQFVKSLDDLMQTAQILGGGFVDIKQVKYHGAKLNIVYSGNPFQGTSTASLFYTVHKGWFAMGQTPQPLKGLILRLNGKLPSWQASKEAKQVLAKFPKQFTGINYSDPRPTMQGTLATLPALVVVANNVLAFALPPDAPQLEPFPVELIPNAYVVSKHLFPNVTMNSVDGQRYRAETRASLLLPF